MLLLFFTGTRAFVSKTYLDTLLLIVFYRVLDKYCQVI